MVPYGAYIKQLRKSKSMTQKELARGIVSEHFLSEFERGHTKISMDHLMLLLERMNISLEEFAVYLVPDVKTQEEFFDVLLQAVSYEDLYLLEKIRSEQEALYQKSYNVRYRHREILVKAYINQLAHVAQSKEELRLIRDYLFNVDDWGYYELELFKQSSPFLSSSVLHKFVPQLRKKGHLYLSSRLYAESIGMILLEVAYADLQQNHVRDALDSIKLLEELLEKRQLFFMTNRKNFLKGICLIKTGNLTQGLTQVQKSIDLLYEMEEIHLVWVYKKQYKELTGRSGFE